MARYLCISTSLLSGRYHGREWPPSPARLLRALLAGIMTGGYRRHWPDVQAGFNWLESQPPPEIVAPPATRASSYQLSVPNNDSDAIARTQKKPEAFRPLKAVHPRVVSPPRLHYLWRLPGGQGVELQPFVLLARCLHTLGWGIDMAFADASLLDEAAKSRLEGELYVPAPGVGLALEVPVEGFVKDLLDTYQRFCRRISKAGVNPDVRPTTYGIQRYRRAGDAQPRAVAFSLKALDGRSPYAAPWYRAMLVASWLRHAAAEALRQEGYPTEEINRLVLGHPESPQDRGRHMSFVPLPSVGHVHSDGRIRRVLLVEPLDSAGEVVGLLETKLAGHVLTDERGSRICVLAEPDQTGRVWSWYRGSSQVWRSVTPVVLHGHNTSHGRLSLAKTEKLLYEAFQRGSHPSAAVWAVYFQPAPLWAGAEGARKFRVPQHLSRWPRYHVEVHFRHAVSGPVLAGIGRHFGIGVFATPRPQ